MRLINQFSALLLFILPLGTFLVSVLIGKQFPNGRRYLIVFSGVTTFLILYFMFLFRTGLDTATPQQVESFLDQPARQIVFVELYSDY